MASAPQSNQLPLFYKDLAPLNLQDHGNFRARRTDKAPWLASQHAIPLTVEEISLAQRDYPVVFSSGDNPVPLGLMGMSEGVNVFVEEDGTLKEQVYMPAYVRRYPFLLAKIKPEAEELSLCFDPTSDLVGEFEDGELLFENGEASEHTQNTLKFCEQFELSGNKTASFIAELNKHELLMEGELSVKREGIEDPVVYRGFKMVNQDKLRELRGDVLRTWNQNGMLPLIFAHLYSLDLVRDIVGRQIRHSGPAEQLSTGNAADGAAPSND